MSARVGCIATLGVFFALTSLSHAGMPSVLPEDIRTVLRLHEEPQQRIKASSFFLAALALTSFAIQILWNYLARDFQRLPKLSYLRAVSLVVLWGALFVIVLTMISRARELMTPGEWKKDGLTYKLGEGDALNDDEVDVIQARGDSANESNTTTTVAVPTSNEGQR